MEQYENIEVTTENNGESGLYYAIVSDCGQETVDKNQDGYDFNKISYFTIHQDSATDSIISQNEDSLDNTVQFEIGNGLGTSSETNSLKLITLEDGRMFLTNTEEVSGDNLELIEPYLITNQDKSSNDTENFFTEEPGEEPIETEEPIIEDDSENTKEESLGDLSGYNVIQIVDDSQNVYNMLVYNETEATEDAVKVEVQKRKFSCLYDGCEKEYTSSNQLTVHMRNHVNSKPYTCTCCDKKFSTNYSLKSHLRTHTGEKPYDCKLCQKSFRTSGDLQKHIRTHTGEKPFLCPFDNCGKSFTTSNIRKVHVRSHTGERPYVCDYPNCGKAFSSSTNYKNHTRIHSGEKPYVCSIEGCDKRFTEYSSLYKHTMVHQIERLFECTYCTQRFKTESSLNLHKRIRHNVIVSGDGIDILVNINTD